MGEGPADEEHDFDDQPDHTAEQDEKQDPYPALVVAGGPGLTDRGNIPILRWHV